MRINIICPQCSQATGGYAVFHVEEIREDGLYTGKCPNGHDLLVGTQTLPHEMLFEIALNAIVDGYRREAISSFSSSVERFYEFSLRVLAKHHKVDAGVFSQAWNIVNRQSERQLGAFVFLYTASFGEPPVTINTKMVELRNNVIHKGALPNNDDVLKFGASAYDVIQNGIKKLRDACIDDVNAALGDRVTEISSKMGSQYPRSFQVTPTALNVIEDISAGYKSFNDVIACYRISG